MASISLAQYEQLSADSLGFYGLNEDPIKSKDFIHTKFVDGVVESIIAGRSIRLLGAAGMGKSATTRAIQATLREKSDPKSKMYMVPIIDTLDDIIDVTKYCITHHGLIALGQYIIDEFDNYFEKQKDLGNESIGYPPKTRDLRERIVRPGDSLGAPERWKDLKKLLQIIKETDNFKVVILYDDTDKFEFFDDWNGFNSVSDRVHSVVYGFKESENEILQERDKRKNSAKSPKQKEGEKDRLYAFLRRSREVPIPGQEIEDMLHIVRGKLEKKDIEIITPAGIAEGLRVSYIRGTNPAQFNPGIMGFYLSNCVRIGYELREKPIGTRTAEKAAKDTKSNFSTQAQLGDENRKCMDTFLEAIAKAREKYANQPK